MRRTEGFALHQVCGREGKATGHLTSRAPMLNMPG